MSIEGFWNELLSKEFEMKAEILGPEAGMVKQLKFLNRIVTWEAEGVTWEPDPRHAELIIDQLGLQGAKPLNLPGVREETRRSPKEERELEEEVAAVQHRQMCGEHTSRSNEPVYLGDEDVDSIEQKESTEVEREERLVRSKGASAEEQARLAAVLAKHKL